MIGPVDDDEREQLIRALVVERFGGRPVRPGTGESPQVIARRRRVLCGLPEDAPHIAGEAA
ncbi:hypothetical protein ACQP1P_38760 [Dactylosporangium sp. CA-052675]|uniref:hypothetical protein n=1 Tax=Dactylosporangium sp. CA-052675 TaxID=3239927 RepID=UPI003D8E0185